MLDGGREVTPLFKHRPQVAETQCTDLYLIEVLNRRLYICGLLAECHHLLIRRGERVLESSTSSVEVVIDHFGAGCDSLLLLPLDERSGLGGTLVDAPIFGLRDGGMVTDHLTLPRYRNQVPSEGDLDRDWRCFCAKLDPRLRRLIR